ncbi:MAG: rhodanese-like domain-containing protein [Bacteroidota bacterium]|nr:rhodanese-like domain-containing protein [Bacteroidota bacterium]
MKKSIFSSTLAIGIIMMLFAGCGEEEIIYDKDLFVTQALETADLMSVEDLKNVIDTGTMYLILDVREPNEHNPGYIPGSVNLPRGLVEFNIAKTAYWESKFLYEPLKTDLIIVYCKRGHRGILVAATLEKMGYTNVKYLDGGFKKWELTYPNVYDKNEVMHQEEQEVGGC